VPKKRLANICVGSYVPGSSSIMPEKPDLIETQPTDRADSQTHAESAVGSYQLIKVLGEGGMGIVHQAMQPNTGRIVAVKILKGPRRRFENECRALARLNHAGIAQIYDAGIATRNGTEQSFFAMEFISGQPLNEYRKTAALTVRQLLRLIVKILEPIQYAHDHNVIHCDLKPANILVEASGQPKILDFGVARLTDAESGAIASRDEGEGTVSYMSPEQTKGEDLDTRSDVYSMGVIAYELLINQLPYQLEGKTAAQKLQIVRDEEPTRLTGLAGNLGRDIEAIVFKALEKDPRKRYQSAQEFGDDINRLLRGQSIHAGDVTYSMRFRSWATRDERIRQATTFCMYCFAANAIFDFYFSLRGLLVILGTAEPFVGVDTARFTIQMAFWRVVQAGLAYACWRGSRRDTVAIRVAIFGTMSVCAFTAAVWLNVFPYEAAGALSDPQTRELMYTALFPLATIGVLLLGPALATDRRLRRLDAQVP